MENINFIFPEIFISLSILFLLIFGVFKKNSSSVVYSLAVITLIISLGLIINFPTDQETYLFSNSYKIDQLSIFMKIITERLITMQMNITTFMRIRRHFIMAK